MVVGTVSIVAILVTIMLVMGLFNYQMKVTNRGSKQNFYDAEQVLDEIRLGLQQDASVAMSAAYVETCNSYDEENMLENTKRFNNLYLERVRESVASPKNSSHYDTDHLLGFLDEKVKNHTTLTTSKGRNPVLSVSSKGVVLKNLYLTYINEEDYVSRVATDIHIKIPDMNFSGAQNVPNLLQYCLVANKGITTESGTETVTFDGNVYAGNTGNSNPEFWANSSKEVNIAAGRTLVVEDRIRLGRGSLKLEKEGEIWAKDVEIQSSGQMLLDGSAYIENDLTLLSGDMVVTGKYQGFGNPKAALQSEAVKEAGLQNDVEENPADYSSAVIVQGGGISTKSKLDFSSTDRLMLAGNAYIGDSKVFMGESLTVRSNQIAYLVPESCMMGLSNPIPPDTRDAHLGITASDTEEEKKSKEQAFKGQLLFRVQTGVSSGVEDVVQMVDQRGFYYYYMKFSNAKTASQYFASNIERAESARLKGYTDYYLSEAKINPSADKNLNGNVLVYDENGISVIGDTIEEGNQDITQESETMRRLVNYYDMFHALKTNLTRDYASLTGAQKSRERVYDNVFDDKKFFVRIAPGIKLSYQRGNKVYAGIIVGGGANYDMSLSSITSSARSAARKKFGQDKDVEVCLVIADGNLVIDESFDGLIICGEKVKIKPKSTGDPNIRLGTADPVGIAGLSDVVFHPMDSIGNVQSGRVDEEYTLKDFMYGSEMYLGKSFATEGRGDNRIALEDLVVYENWSKQ